MGAIVHPARDFQACCLADLVVEGTGTEGAGRAQPGIRARSRLGLGN